MLLRSAPRLSADIAAVVLAYAFPLSSAGRCSPPCSPILSAHRGSLSGNLASDNPRSSAEFCVSCAVSACWFSCCCGAASCVVVCATLARSAAQSPPAPRELLLPLHHAVAHVVLLVLADERRAELQRRRNQFRRASSFLIMASPLTVTAFDRVPKAGVWLIG